MISSQKWDELSKQWVITTLKAPTNVVTKEILDKLDIKINQENTQNNAT